MNSLQRITAVLTGQPTDRRAVVPVLCLYGARLIRCPLERYYTDPAAYAEGQAAVAQEFDPDVLLAPFVFALLGQAFGGEIHWVPDQAPNLRRPAVSSADGMKTLPWPDLKSSPQLTYLRESVRRMAVAHQGHRPVAAVLPPPTDLPALIMGMESWMETVLFDPAQAEGIMDKAVPFFVGLANSLFDSGAAFVVLPCAFGSPAVVSRETAKSFAHPVLEKTLARLKGPALLHHGGAPLAAHLDLMADLPFAAVGLDENDDCAGARKILGPGTVLFGGPAGPRFPDLTPAQIQSECRRILAACSGDPRFILYTSAADVPLHTPPENLTALRKCADAFPGIPA